MQRFLNALILWFLASDLAFAAVGGGGGLPWESPLSTLKDSIAGPVAALVVIIAVVILGIMLISGADMMQIGKSLVGVVVAGAMIIGASTFVTKLFGVSGAVIQSSEEPKIEQNFEHEEEVKDAAKKAPNL